MMPRTSSSSPKRRFSSLQQLVLMSCLGLTSLLPACGGQSDATSTDTGNPPVIIGQKLHVAPSDSGVVVSGEAGAVTPGASVAVENVSRGLSRVTTAAQDGSFQVELDGSPEDEYRVEASLGGRTTNTTLNSSGSQTGLAGREYLLDSAEGFTPVEGTTIRLSFEATDFGISGGCNSMSGSYTQCDGRLCASNLLTTDIGCPAPLASQDEWLADFVTSQPSLTQSGDRLTLAGMDATLEFLDRRVADPDRPLVGEWVIDTLISGGAASSVSAPASIEFRDNGAVLVNSSCRGGGGSFAVSGDVLTLSDMSYPEEVCEPGGVPAVAEQIEQIFTDGTLSFEIEAARLTVQRGNLGLAALASE